MKKQFLWLYHILSWLILFLLFLVVSLFMLLDSSSMTLGLMKESLKKEGITYGEVKGSLLSGFIIEDINYNNQIKASLIELKVDFKKLKKRVLYIDDVKIKNIEVKEEFLNTLLENNSSSSNESNLTLPFDVVIVNNLEFSVLNINYLEYKLSKAEVRVEHFQTDMKENHRGNISLVVDSSIAKVDLDGELNHGLYELSGDLEGEQLFLNPYLIQSNLELLKNPKLNLWVKGDMNRLQYGLKMKSLVLKQGEYWFKSEQLISDGSYNLKDKKLNTTLKSTVDSNVANLKLKAESNLNLNDINETLAFNLDMHLKPKEKLYLQSFKEQNLTIQSMPYIDLKAKGNLKQMNFSLVTKDLRVKQNDIALNLKDLGLKGRVHPLKGDINAKLLTHFDSSVANGSIDAKSELNFKDVNNSLHFDLIGKVDVEPKYVNRFLVDSNLTLSGKTPIEITAKGDMNRLNVKLIAKSNLETKGVKSTVELKSSNIEIKLKEHQVDGELYFNSNGKNIALNLKSNFSGDYLDLEKLNTTTNLELKEFNAFGVNLNSLTPLVVKVEKKVSGANIKLNSKKINLSAYSSDFDKITFSLKTDNIYPYKIVKLPVELDKKFIKVNLKGSATLSKEYFSLVGKLESNRQFKMSVDAHNKKSGLDVNLLSKTFKLKANGNLLNKDIVLEVNINSLKALQKELNSLYTFEPLAVDGKVELKSYIEGEEVSFLLKSPKLQLDGFNIEKLGIEGEYKRELIALNQLSFNTTGFSEPSLNQNYYLNQKGIIHLGEKRDLLLDIHPKILVTAKGDKNNLKARLRVETLPIGHPKYGTTLLTCDIDYIQKLQKKTISGGVFLDKLKLFYESKYLDPSSDNDVIVLTKKDKTRAKVEDSFLKNTAVNLAVYASDANYKTRDIDLRFTVNVKAIKKFGKSLRMIGKIEGIKGRVEQAPKLFSVVDSNIVFRGAKEINPLLDLKVEHELPDVLITINIHGNAKRPKLTFSSEPPLPKKDILSYLLLGVSTANLAEGKGSLGREAQLFIMNQAARDLAYDLELDRVFIKDDGTGEGYAVQVGKKVKKDTMVIIENSKEGNSFILEYDVSKNIKVEVGQHQKTLPSQSIDIYYRKRFK